MVSERSFSAELENANACQNTKSFAGLLGDTVTEFDAEKHV